MVGKLGKKQTVAVMPGKQYSSSGLVHPPLKMP
jgi:hypothetical protein